MVMQRPTRPVLPALWCLGAAALFGVSTPAAKALLGPLGPVTLAGLLYLGAALGVLPFALRGPRPRWGDRRNLARLGGAVLFGGALGPVLLLAGLSRAPAASVSLWLNLETPATALLAFAFFREHLDRRTGAAVLLVFLASVVLASPSGFAGALPALLVAAACVAWALDNNFTALVDGFTAAQATAIKGLVAGAVNLALGAFFEGQALAAPPLALALVVGALGYGASLVLYISGAHHLGATRSQALFATAPFWGVGAAWLAGGEAATLAQGLAAAIMLVSLWLLYGARHAHLHTHARASHTHWHRHDDAHHDHDHEALPAGTWHAHPHEHQPETHEHPHLPDLHHRHGH